MRMFYYVRNSRMNSNSCTNRTKNCMYIQIRENFDIKDDQIKVLLLSSRIFAPVDLYCYHGPFLLRLWLNSDHHLTRKKYMLSPKPRASV